MTDKSKNIGHRTITTGAAKHLILQLPKSDRQFQEGRTIAQGTGLALDDRKEMPLSFAVGYRGYPTEALLATIALQSLALPAQATNIPCRKDRPPRWA